MITLRVLLLTAVAALALVACGGSDEDKIRDTYSSYSKALADGETEKACEYLTPQAVNRLKSLGAKSCPAALKQGFAALNRKQRSAFKKVKITNVTVTGEKATITLEFPKNSGIPTAPQALSKVDGDWKLEAAAA